MRRPGLEPGSAGWKPTMITPTLTTLSRQPDSNQRPKELQSSALPTELYRDLRYRQGLNLRGQSPIDFKSISLTTRTRYHIIYVIFFKQFKHILILSVGVDLSVTRII